MAQLPVRMLCSLTTIPPETDASAPQTKHHPGPKTNKPTSRNPAFPHHRTTSASSTNGTNPSKKTRPKNQGSVLKRRGIDIKVHSRMRRISTTTRSLQRLLSGRSSTYRSTRTIRTIPSAVNQNEDMDKVKSQTLVFLLKNLKRSFILSTHGGRRPHLTMIMFSSNVTTLPKGSTTDSGELIGSLGSDLSPPNLVTRSKDSRRKA